MTTYKEFLLWPKQQQINLIKNFFGLEEDGIYDFLMMAAIKNFQKENNLIASGIFDEKTFSLLIVNSKFKDSIKENNKEIIINNSEELNMENDINTTHDLTTDLMETGIVPNIEKRFLPKDEYVNESVPVKEYIFIHHTAGWENPYSVIDSWENDKLGKIATHYVIGGINFKKDTVQFDGKIVQCIPDINWAYHLGGSPISSYMHKHSIGIEICNFGWLTEKNGKYYTYTGAEVLSKYVGKLDKPFRGYSYYHKYTDKQIESLYQLIMYLGKKYNINVEKGLKERLKTMTPDVAVGYDENIVAGNIKGVLTHTNVRRDKWDIMPQPQIIEMIKKLHND